MKIEETFTHPFITLNKSSLTHVIIGEFRNKIFQDGYFKFSNVTDGTLSCYCVLFFIPIGLHVINRLVKIKKQIWKHLKEFD